MISENAETNEKADGQCLCGAVSFACDMPSPSVGACHCLTRRSWGGGPLPATDCSSIVAFQGESNISIYTSSERAERAFYKICGSHLFYRLKHGGRHTMPAGPFRNGPDFNLDHQIFIDEKPDYFSFANKTHNMTGEEIFARAQADQP